MSAISSTHPKDTPDSEVLFDSGANCCASNVKTDFVGKFNESDGRSVVDGIGKGLKICGTGKVAWLSNMHVIS